MKALAKFLLLGIVAGLVSSCYYDPYYSGYSSSYGIGGGTTFIHTSSDRWFYDSSLRCYYDRNRSAYYDPWIGGYYPVGYCPKPVYRVPHPYGWNGKGVCPTPRNIRSHTISGYNDRLSHYRKKNYSWANTATVRNDSSVANWQRNRLKAARSYTPHTSRDHYQRQNNRHSSQATNWPQNIWGQRSQSYNDRDRSHSGIPSNNAWNNRSSQHRSNYNNSWQQQNRPSYNNYRQQQQNRSNYNNRQRQTPPQNYNRVVNTSPRPTPQPRSQPTTVFDRRKEAIHNAADAFRNRSR